MSRITKSAKGQACQVRIPGVCHFETETVVLAHRNGYGMGGKSPDYQGAYCCHRCHDVVDGRDRQHPFTDDEVLVYFYEGVFRTQELLQSQGLIKITGDKR